MYRAARETAARDGSDRRRWWLRIEICRADCRSARVESEGPWVFSINGTLFFVLCAWTIEKAQSTKNKVLSTKNDEKSRVVTSFNNPDHSRARDHGVFRRASFRAVARI